MREKKLRKSHKLPFVVVLNITMCSLDVNINVVRATASDKELERRQVWEMRRIVCNVFSLWLINLQFLQHWREQWTGAMPSLVRTLNVYSKVY